MMGMLAQTLAVYIRALLLLVVQTALLLGAPVTFAQP